MTRFTRLGRPVSSGIPSFRLSVAPTSMRILRWMQWTLVAVILCAWGLSGWWWWDSRTVAEEAARYAAAAARTEDLNRQFAAAMGAEQLTLTPNEIAAIKQEVAFVNQLAEKRSFSWTQLLSDLEQALPAGIAIGKIQLDRKESVVAFDGIAPRMQDLNALMTGLQTHPSFSRPVLHHHKVIEADKRQSGSDANDRVDNVPAGVEYSLTVHYRRPL